MTALDDVTFGIEAGTCHAVVGENGAGKSTLGRILTGIYDLDGGQIRIDGRSVQLIEPRDALDMGIGMVHQELVFCENLSVAENLCLGTLPARGGFVSDRSMEERARRMLEAVDADMDVGTSIGDPARRPAATGADCRGPGQAVPGVIVFDEPTSSLSHVEAKTAAGEHPSSQVEMRDVDLHLPRPGRDLPPVRRRDRAARWTARGYPPGRRARPGHADQIS